MNAYNVYNPKVGMPTMTDSKNMSASDGGSSGQLKNV
jgi:hypothetical protein